MRGIGQQQQDDANSCLAWLRSIAANRIRDAARSAKCLKRGGGHGRVPPQPDPFRANAGNLLEELGTDSSTPSRVAARFEAVDAMQIALAALPGDQREALRLHYFERLSLEATAEAMGRSMGSVRGLIQRAKQKLRDHLDRGSKWLSG
jgi:RNA polymerase sigma-70 factor (ECF subfamily)